MNVSRFTCITCRVAFFDPEIQRQHYKTDWHRYNLKRKVAELPPVTAEEFQHRVLTQREQDDAHNNPISIHCTFCRKSFNTQNAYDNHLNSKKHKELVFEANPDLAKDLDEDDVTESPTRPRPSPSVGDAAIPIIPQTSKPSSLLDHTKKPRLMSTNAESIETDSDIEEVDSDEWDDEEQDNPILNNDCLFCDNHSRTMMKNLNHMTVAHSFFVPDAEFVVDMQGLLIYLGEKVFEGFMCLWCNDRGRTFYTADAAQRHMRDKGHTKMLHEGEALAEYAEFYDYSSSYPDQATGDADEEVAVAEIDGADYQLVLPSGATIGHRSLMRYYKQNFNPNRAVVPQKKLHRVLAQYRALGWTATQQEAASRKARDIHYMRRIQSKHYAKIGIKANKFQTHYRPQVNF